MSDPYKSVLDKLIAQIAIYTGKDDGGLATLQDWYHQHHLKRKPTICSVCGWKIEKDGHDEDCSIVNLAIQKMKG